MTDLLFAEEAYIITGICMDIHNELGTGFAEIVYKDALEYEFRKKNIPFAREQQFSIRYKEIILPHSFYADFVVMDKIILEVKTVSQLGKAHMEQTMNYLCASGLKLGLLVNFRGPKLQYRRLIFSNEHLSIAQKSAAV